MHAGLLWSAYDEFRSNPLSVLLGRQAFGRSAPEAVLVAAAKRLILQHHKSQEAELRSNRNFAAADTERFESVRYMRPDGLGEVMLFLMTGLHTGIVGISIHLFDAEPDIDESWEEIVDVSFRAPKENHYDGIDCRPGCRHGRPIWKLPGAVSRPRDADGQ